MNTITKDIESGNYKRVYLLCGAEGYLRSQFKNRLKNALVSGEDDMNFAYYEDSSVTDAQIIEFCDTMPFLSNYRVIILSGINIFKSGRDELATYIPNIPDTSILIIEEEKADKRSKIYKAIDKAGYVANFETQSEDILMRWVKGKFAESGYTIGGRAMSIFFKRCGKDMSLLDNEIKKLSSYCMGKKEITEEDVKAVCVELLEDRVFEMIDYMSNHNQVEALKIYHDLLRQRKEPASIMALIARQYRILLNAKRLKNEGIVNKRIGEITGVRYYIDKYVNLSSKYKEKTLIEALEMTADNDRAFKMGNLDKNTAVELLIVRLSSKEDAQ